MSYNVVKMTESVTLGFNLLKNGLPVVNFCEASLPASGGDRMKPLA
jgi:hypothetical protein